MSAKAWCCSPHLLGNKICQLLLLRPLHKLQAVCCTLLQAQDVCSGVMSCRCQVSQDWNESGTVPFVTKQCHCISLGQAVPALAHR